MRSSEIDPRGVYAAYLERRFRAKLPRELRDKLEQMRLISVNGTYDAWQVDFSTGQQAVIPARKLVDDAIIAQLCVQIR